VDIENEESLKIKGMVEKPKPEDAPSNLAIIGRYILEPEIFDKLENTGKGAGGEYQLTDAMAAMLTEKDFYAHKLNGKRFDCGSRVGFLEANIAFALERDDMKDRVKEMLKEFIE
jgi:UTP--glucose-1-phosphate uridylyltransferase